jgi:formate hydrogenlyase subunit 6/NADH:ubiquinone oxidoreductase subunit I
MLKIEKSRLSELFDAISAEMALYVPSEKNNSSEYAQWDGENASLDILNTTKPVKSLFFPQSETIVSFKTSGKNIEIKEQEKADAPFAVYGVRACDAYSMENVLDRVFLSEPADEFYKARRENGIMITSACGEPEETCFCSVFGIDSAECAYGDATTWTVGDTVYLRANTDKGAKLLTSVGAVLTECADDAADAFKAEAKNITAQLPLASLSLDGFGAGATAAKFNSPKWEELAKSCIGCGTCTFVCPTCQCYDIRDFDTGHGVQRYRCWDSCMYSDFTLMAHGNPRKSQTERFRQRFMHKLVYFPDNNGGEFSCVGCGRCLAKCPVSMNIVKVIKNV